VLGTGESATVVLVVLVTVVVVASGDGIVVETVEVGGLGDVVEVLGAHGGPTKAWV
jgi:hypothetical protein